MVELAIPFLCPELKLHPSREAVQSRRHRLKLPSNRKRGRLPTMEISTWTSMLGASVKFDGRKYPGRYFEAGSGEPLLLLHGGGGYAENFSRNIMVYAKYFHVFAL